MLQKQCANCEMCHVSENVIHCHPYSHFTGTVGSKEEDRQMVQLLKEEQAQITQRIESLRKDVRRDIRHRTS